MCEIQKLLSKKDGFLIEIACIVQDLKEFINNPVETVPVDQLHYQYDFIIRQLREIDRKIYAEFSKQILSFEVHNSDLKKLTDKATATIVFTVKDLPKHHWSMFEANTANQ